MASTDAFARRLRCTSFKGPDLLVRCALPAGKFVRRTAPHGFQQSLNPVRAGMAGSLEESTFTSVYDRITARQGKERLEALKAEGGEEKREKGKQSRKSERHTLTEAQKKMVAGARVEAEAAQWLSPLEVGGRKAGQALRAAKGSENGTLQDLLGVGVEEYVALVEWTGAQISGEKERGRLPEEMLPLVQRLDLDAGKWVKTVQGYGRLFHRVRLKKQRGSEELQIYDF